MMNDDAALLKTLEKRDERSFLIMVTLCISIVVLFVVCLMFGAASYTIEDVLAVFRGEGDWGITYIVYNLRIPREICALVVGAGLSIAGVGMQAMFRNPMASPSVLGLSSGASFGACLALAFGIGSFLGGYPVPIMAFIFCFVTMFLVYGLATTRYGTPVTLLLLSGIAVGALFSGMTSFVEYIVESDVLQGIVFWTMGGFSRCFWSQVSMGCPIIILGILMIAVCHRELNLISLGEEQAESLGVNIRRTRFMLLIGTSLAVGGSVAISGVIGFVGLIIPHVCRALCGPNHKMLIPMSILVGAVFMILMDTLAKTIMAPAEMPVGILTSLLGAPFFIYIMRKKRAEFWG
ncbi:iron ABC transporter permease protein [methanogenic archaeon mixed culture ISO4-G1]|nr:iron ABC transporter permease protein [methanogenic archaeon mixed culture ISO4-G1]